MNPQCQFQAKDKLDENRKCSIPIQFETVNRPQMQLGHGMGIKMGQDGKFYANMGGMVMNQKGKMNLINTDIGVHHSESINQMHLDPSSPIRMPPDRSQAISSQIYLSQENNGQFQTSLKNDYSHQQVETQKSRNARQSNQKHILSSKEVLFQKQNNPGVSDYHQLIKDYKDGNRKYDDIHAFNTSPPLAPDTMLINEPHKLNSAKNLSAKGFMVQSPNKLPIQDYRGRAIIHQKMMSEEYQRKQQRVYSRISNSEKKQHPFTQVKEYSDNVDQSSEIALTGAQKVIIKAPVKPSINSDCKRSYKRNQSSDLLAQNSPSIDASQSNRLRAEAQKFQQFIQSIENQTNKGQEQVDGEQRFQSPLAEIKSFMLMKSKGDETRQHLKQDVGSQIVASQYKKNKRIIPENSGKQIANPVISNKNPYQDQNYSIENTFNQIYSNKTSNNIRANLFDEDGQSRQMQLKKGQFDEVGIQRLQAVSSNPQLISEEAKEQHQKLLKNHVEHIKRTKVQQMVVKSQIKDGQTINFNLPKPYKNFISPILRKDSNLGPDKLPSDMSILEQKHEADRLRQNS